MSQPHPEDEFAAAWEALRARVGEISRTSLRELFATEPDRAERLTVTAGDLRADLSKNLIDAGTVDALVRLAKAAKVPERFEAMASGRHINTTEDRAVLHVALRAPKGATLKVDGQDVVGDVHRELARMEDFATRVRSGEWTGSTGRPIEHVVNIGIGGSDLGPKMAARALRGYTHERLSGSFVSNVDPTDIADALGRLDPETTLVIVSSKTFTTQETLANANVARRWLLDAFDGNEDALKHHLAAVSTNLEATAEFGVADETVFGFWDWVGGRYSLDSAIGLSLLLLIGPENFRELLAGFRAIDEHVATTPVERNLPVLLGLLGTWYTSVLGAQSHAVLPYSQDLEYLPAYLQQLTMESNGKSVTFEGKPAGTTGEIYWGASGTNGQHAFYQLLHQGSHLIPADFIGFINPRVDRPAADGTGSMHDLLNANLFAQTKVLAFGKTPEELAAEGVPEDLVAHKTMPGNRPSTTILADRLTPRVLGELVALYEHAVFTQGTLLRINSFDQWGVELGKKQANDLAAAVAGEEEPDSGDASTNALIAHYRARRTHEELAAPQDQPEKTQDHPAEQDADDAEPETAPAEPQEEQAEQDAPKDDEAKRDGDQDERPEDDAEPQGDETDTRDGEAETQDDDAAGDDSAEQNGEEPEGEREGSEEDPAQQQDDKPEEQDKKEK